MLRRWDDILVQGGASGRATRQGDVREFLDLLIGHEWGHAAANLSGLRSRVKWVDEFMATYLFLAALEAADLDTRSRNASPLGRGFRWRALRSSGLT